MLLLYLSLLVAGRFGCCSTDVLVVPLNSDVCLPCPGHTGSGDVTWKRHRHEGEVTLVTVTNGHKRTSDPHYDSNADRSLVIYKVQSSDETMYLCNNKRIYLNVTSDPNMAAATAQPGCPVQVTPRITGSGPDPGPGLGPNPDQWKIPVGVVIGVSVVLVAMLVLKLLSERRRRSNGAQSDRIYEEIQDLEVETPYYTNTTHTDTHSDTHTHTALYSTVNKPRRECVYSLVQSPDSGNNREEPAGAAES